MYVSPSKCEFMIRETEFLGIVVGGDGVKVSSEKVAAVKVWPKPSS